MPRMMRFEHPGSLVHIMARGINGLAIFVDNEDRNEFIKRFAHCLGESGYRCLCWCLLSNHYHLFLRTSEIPMSSVMRPLNGGYARWFNRKYKRRGYLFQDRFKSVLCQDMEYARQLIRYVHLNPIRAGAVTSLAALRKWAWCGHGYILNVSGAKGRGFQDRNEVLRRFGKTPEDAIISYLNFLQEGIDEERPEMSGRLSESEAFEIAGSNKGWPAVIGDSEFARIAMQRHEVAAWRRHRQADYSGVLENIVSEVCRHFEINHDYFFRKGRMNTLSVARECFCYRAHYEEKIPFAVIARFLGITVTPVMFLARRGKEKLSKI